MIVDDFNMVRIAIVEFKTDSPTAINANTVLLALITSQSFQPVSRRNAQILNLCC